jgi:hypothetical protein
VLGMKERTVAQGHGAERAALCNLGVGIEHISGICGGPLCRIATPYWFASDANPSRNLNPIARMWPGTSVSRAIGSVARAAAIATVPHQNEPVTKTLVAASRNRSLPVTAASA